MASLSLISWWVGHFLFLRCVSILCRCSGVHALRSESENRIGLFTAPLHFYSLLVVECLSARSGAMLPLMSPQPLAHAALCLCLRLPGCICRGLGKREKWCSPIAIARFATASAAARPLPPPSTKAVQCRSPLFPCRRTLNCL